MFLSKSSLIGTAKVLLALAIIGSTAAVASRPLLPDVPVSTLVIYGVLALIVLTAASAALLVASLTLRQFILRKGGMDTQWLWFDRDPKGLVALRRKDDADQ
ncbi:hypothetical protein [Chitinimonas naiadis]